jgi:FkbM family methyltransferase
MFFRKRKPSTFEKLKVNSIISIFKLSKSAITLDLGANIGNITKEMADTGATVYAFEPNPFAFAKLKERFKDNRNVICINKAVLDKESTLPLYFHKNSNEDEILWSSGSSMLDFKKNVLKEKKVDVETVDLVAFIKELDKPIDLIKMDIEGVECKVINHLIDSNMMGSIKFMIVETHDHKIQELKEETDALRKRIKDSDLEKKINLNWI